MSHHILNRAYELGETISLPANSPRHSPTDYTGDTQLCISVKSEIVEQQALRRKLDFSIIDQTKKVFCISSYLYHNWMENL